MRTREFLDWAVTLTETFDLWARVSPQVAETELQTFWSASRARFNAWGFALHQCRADLGSHAPHSWMRWEPLLEEILMSELLTRVVCTILEELDSRRGTREYGPIAQSIFSGHLEARVRTLRLLLDGRDAGVERAARLNRLRLQMEQWTDLLLAHFPSDGPAAAFCFDTQRWQSWSDMENGHRRGPLVLLRLAAGAALGDTGDVAAERLAYYQQMHASVLGMLGPELFSATGPRLSSWQARLLSLTHDSEGVLSRWLADAMGKPSSRADDWARDLPNAPKRFPHP